MTLNDHPATDTGWPEIDHLAPTISVDPRPFDGWYVWGKVVADYLLALAILVVALPLIGICWVVVKATSAGPGFYSQTRLGRNGKAYPIYKLRSMTVNAEVAGAQWAQKVDCRVTRVGKFLRASHFDELPQLFNVLFGQMSLVGPRPERPEMIRNKGLDVHVPGYRHRLLVRPGVTGLAQLQVAADTDLDSVRHKVVYDLFYIQNASFWFDLRILAATAFKAAGLRPKWLRRLFFLPHRDRVAETFRGNLATTREDALGRLQPA